ncbi:MAG: AsmA family protein [Acidobacteriota bacterium]
MEKEAAPEEHTAPPPRVVKPLSRLIHRAEEALTWLEASDLGSAWGNRIVYWIKHFGIIQALGVIIAVGLPLVKFEWLPHVASTTASSIAEAHGMDLEVEDWTGELFHLRAAAHGVRIKSRGPQPQPDLFRADRVEFKVSLWHLLSKGRWIDEVTFESPSIHLERSLSGRWNWQDAVTPEGSAVPATENPSRLASASETLPDQSHEAATSWSINIPHLVMQDLRIQWVENLPADSGSGLIRSSKAAIYVDDVGVTAHNVYGPAGNGEGATEFSLEGRTADGRISINGLVNFYAPHGGELKPSPYLTATTSRSVDPRLETSIYLENVGAAAIATMVQPSLVPGSGTVSGRIELVLRQQELACSANLIMNNVTYSPAPDSPLLRHRGASLRTDLQNFRANGPIVASCSGSFDNERYRPLGAIESAVTRQAVSTAPPTVRAVATIDERRLSGGNDGQGIEDLTREISSEIGRTSRSAVNRGLRKVRTGLHNIAH